MFFGLLVSSGLVFQFEVKLEVLKDYWDNHTGSDEVTIYSHQSLLDY